MTLSLLTAALALIAALLAVVLWSVKQHREPTLPPHCDESFETLLPSLAGLTHGALTPGNAVELLADEAYFHDLLAAIAAARHHVHFETFLWKRGDIGTRLAQTLAERARAGVQVRVLVDARGGRFMGRETRRLLRGAGCRLVAYHRWAWRNLGVMNRRDHRKIAVIDGALALVGGHCVVDRWWQDGPRGPRFHDLAVRLRGPAINAVQSAFSENWMAETGELLVGERFFPRHAPAGEVELHVARAKPERAPPAVKVLHHLVLCLARQRVWIQNPYFLPKPAAIQALAAAVRRGVDVRVMVPAAKASDMPMVQHAAHRHFESLLRAGVRLFEYQPTLIHQKVMAIDGLWCAIGSSNFDDRSFDINDEITLGIRDPALARQLEAIFERDLRDCIELELASWHRRGWLHKLQDNAMYLFHKQL